MRTADRQRSQDNLIFVYGALRSGTTVLNLMMDGHPQIHNPGELDPLFDYLHRDASRPDGWAYDLAGLAEDRMFRDSGLPLPDGLDGLELLYAFIDAVRGWGDGQSAMSITVHRNAPKIAEIFPTAPIIHLLRDPRDVARSAVGMGWAGNPYFGIDNWITTETDWDAAKIDPSRVLTLKFEDLMADPEGHLTQVAKVHGLSYHPDMLRYPDTTTYGPPDPAACEQWRRKASPNDVGLVESKIADLMTARGYPPEHLRPAPTDKELAGLKRDNKVRRWRFNIRRFGLPLFLSRHAAKRLGLVGLERRLKQRQDTIVNENRK